MKRCPECGAAVALPAHPLSTGYYLADWMVCGSIGVGRNGSIYQAQSSDTRMLAALRVPEDDLMGAQGNADAFREYVGRLQGLQHPNITQILFSGSIGDVCFYAMEFCDGGCLPVLLLHGRLDEAKAWRVLEQLADGLAYLHRQHCVPLDLNPSKVVFDHQGNAKWSDFVLARPLRADDGPPHLPPRFGTPGYVSPEQARGEPVDARSNLYSLGAIAFEMLTGRPPFAKATGAETLAAQWEEPVPDPSAFAPVSHWTAVLVQRLLDKDPAERFQNADHLVAALRASPPPPPPPRRRVPIVKRATTVPKVVRAPAATRPAAAVRPQATRPPARRATDVASPPPVKPRHSLAPLIVFAGLLAAGVLVEGLIGWRVRRQQQLQREYDAEVRAAMRQASPPKPEPSPAATIAEKPAQPEPPQPSSPPPTPIKAAADGSFTLPAASAILHSPS